MNRAKYVVKTTAAERKASNERIEADHAATIAAVTVNRCPVCGRTLRHNLSITGWWQCSQFGAVGWHFF